MNPDAAKTIPAGYLGQQSHAEFVREAYREQGRKQEQERIINLVKAEIPLVLQKRFIELIKGEQK